MPYPASVSALSALPSSAASTTDSSTLSFTVVVRLFSASFVANVELATSLSSFSVSSLLMLAVFVAMFPVFVTTSDALAYLRSATSVLTFLFNSSVTSCFVKTSYAPPVFSFTCTDASATPNPPQRRESAIRDARRERLVTPPIFSEPVADFV